MMATMIAPHNNYMVLDCHIICSVKDLEAQHMVNGLV